MSFEEPGEPDALRRAANACLNPPHPADRHRGMVLLRMAKTYGKTQDGLFHALNGCGIAVRTQVIPSQAYVVRVMELRVRVHAALHLVHQFLFRQCAASIRYTPPHEAIFALF